MTLSKDVPTTIPVVQGGQVIGSYLRCMSGKYAAFTKLGDHLGDYDSAKAAQAAICKACS